MENKIITARSAQELNEDVAEHIKAGFVPVGGHSVVRVLEQLVYAGMQHKHTTYQHEYSQTMQKVEEPSKKYKKLES